MRRFAYFALFYWCVYIVGWLVHAKLYWWALLVNLAAMFALGRYDDAVIAAWRKKVGV